MYELLDAAGATLCDPLLIILLAVMMMPSGGSSYVFSGKTDDVGFLLLKARAAARKLPCAHRRSAQGAQAFILNGGPPISYAEFFDLPARPDNITEAIWKDMSETAFDVIIGFIHDAKHQRLVMGCGRDGGKLLAPNWSKQRPSRLPRTGHQQQDSRHHTLATLLVIAMAHIFAMPSPPTTPLNALAFSPARLLPCLAPMRAGACA